jgi:hypothetical protein
MKISVAIATKSWLDSLNDADHAQKAAAHLKSELNDLIGDADRRLSVPGASRALRRARDRAAQAIATPAEAIVTFELQGVRIADAEIALAPAIELRAELARDAIRTFRRPAQSVPQETPSL